MIFKKCVLWVLDFLFDKVNPFKKMVFFVSNAKPLAYGIILIGVVFILAIPQTYPLLENLFDFFGSVVMIVSSLILLTLKLLSPERLVKNAGNKVKKMATDSIDTVTDSVQEFGQNVATKASDAVGTIKDTSGNIATSIATSIADKSVNALDSIKNASGNVTKKAKEKIKNPFLNKLFGSKNK